MNVLNFPKNKRYEVLYADPPWNFKTFSQKGKEKKSAENHYVTMDDDDIYNLSVDSISDSDSCLFLWVTFPKLIHGLTCMEAWGFNYKTCAFNWIKVNKSFHDYGYLTLPKKSEKDTFMGLGYWTRSNSELCLLGTKGHPKRVSKSVRQIVFEPKREHSRKPDCVRDKIVDLCGDVPRIELFARQKVPGWDSWGNEIKF